MQIYIKSVVIMIQTNNTFTPLLMVVFGFFSVGLGVAIDGIGTMPFWEVVEYFLIGLVSIFGFVLAWGFNKKCPHCQKLFAMKKINKRRVHCDYEWRYSLNKNVKIITYHKQRQCRFCGGKDYIESREEYRPTSR